MSVKTIDFNINHFVLVKLTPEGRNELRRQRERLQKETGYEFAPEERWENEEGYIRLQLHTLMERLGHMCRMTTPLPFETNIKIEVRDD